MDSQIGADKSIYSPTLIQYCELPSLISKTSMGSTPDTSQSSHSGISFVGTPLLFESPGTTVHDCENIDVLQLCGIFDYTIPSFNAITVKLRHVKVTCVERYGSSKVDVFVNASLEIPHIPPFCIQSVKECVVEVR